MDFAPGTFERSLLDHAIGMERMRDDLHACLAHPLDHECDGCRAIRRAGPKRPGNPLARMQQDAQGALVTDAAPAADATEKRRRAGAEKRRIRLSAANRRGIARLSLALAGQRIRNRKAAK